MQILALQKNNYVSDVKGKRLNPSIGIVVIDKVSSSSSEKIKNFAKDTYSRGFKIS